MENCGCAEPTEQDTMCTICLPWLGFSWLGWSWWGCGLGASGCRWRLRLLPTPCSNSLSHQVKHGPIQRKPTRWWPEKEKHNVENFKISSTNGLTWLKRLTFVNSMWNNRNLAKWSQEAGYSLHKSTQDFQMDPRVRSHKRGGVSGIWPITNMD